MNKIFGKINFSYQRIILAFVLSLAFFLSGIAKFKTYQSEMTILVIPKSANAIAQKDQVLSNLLQFPKTLAFYDRLLKDNPAFEDSSAGKSPVQRKATWNRMVATDSVAENGSLISISITAENENDSKLIVSKTVRSLFDFTANYYNVKDDVDLRIIDGPITKVMFVGWPLILIVSIVFGSLLASVIGRLAVLRPKTFDLQTMLKKNPLQDLNRSREGASFAMPIEALEHLYQKETAKEAYLQNDIKQDEETKTQTEVETELETREIPAEEIAHLQAIASRNVYPNFPEMPVHGPAKSVAPENLPIADFNEGAVLSEQDENIFSDKQTEPETKEEKNHEPTKEQLKDRLNQLLRGDL